MFYPGMAKNLGSCGGLECGASDYAVRAIVLDIRPWGFSEKPEGGNFTYNQAGARASPEEDLLIIDTFVSLFYVNDISSTVTRGHRAVTALAPAAAAASPGGRPAAGPSPPGPGFVSRRLASE